MTTATKITFARIALIPIILFFYLSGDIIQIPFFYTYGRLIALVLFIIAAATDWLDGWVARKYNQVSDMGKLLDPIADKMLTLLGFVLVVTDYAVVGALGVLPLWLAVIAIFVAIGRDFVVNALRQLGAEKGITIAADMAGKVKSVMQFIAIPLLMFYAHDFVNSNSILHVGIVLELYEYVCIFVLSAATLLSIYSGAHYLVKYRNVFGMEKPAAKPKKTWEEQIAEKNEEKSAIANDNTNEKKPETAPKPTSTPKPKTATKSKTKK